MLERDGADSGTDDSSPAMNLCPFRVQRTDRGCFRWSTWRKRGRLGRWWDKELNADNRDSAVTAEDDSALDEESSPPKNNPNQMENGDWDHYLMDEIRRLQDLLETTISEKKSAAREYEIKSLTYQQHVPENGCLLADHHEVEESVDRN
ncbi:hypothetical protein SAY86_023120 [Trapa natans]|uniref:Uncharacterized protein n=1 Tax=Trapa natans TaxID=22666 RepID=A0AAN7MA69_TRANT|nr:hypothetical protein SAY86_023120 [Trapa natans]